MWHVGFFFYETVVFLFYSFCITIIDAEHAWLLSISHFPSLCVCVCVRTCWTFLPRLGRVLMLHPASVSSVKVFKFWYFHWLDGSRCDAEQLFQMYISSKPYCGHCVQSLHGLKMYIVSRGLVYSCAVHNHYYIKNCRAVDCWHSCL